MPRRRRRGSAAVAAEAERGLAMRILLHSPKDTLAGALAFTAVSAIIANALFLQAGRHPSPMFGTVVAMPAAGLPAASPLPRPRPLVADEPVLEPKPAELKTIEPKPSEPKRSEARLAEPKPAEPKAADPLANLVKATTPPATTSTVMRPPAPIPVSSHNEAIANAGPRRVAAVQRALTQYGYGQLKPTGTVGSDTQAAIQKFERERKMPVTGHVSDRLVRELTAVIGHPLD